MPNIGKKFTLYTTLRSPFARRIRVALRRLMVDHNEIIMQPEELYPARDDLVHANPLGQVPTLLLPDGVSIVDSPTILHYLDSEIGALWPTNAKHLGISLSAFCQGILTYSVREYQGIQLKSPFNDTIENNIEIVSRILSHIRKNYLTHYELFVPESQCYWDLGIALRYADLRLGGKLNWRDHLKEFILKYDELSVQTLFIETEPPIPKN